MADSFSIYLKEVLEQIPRILSHQDRDPLSPSYGSFDRKYWGWKYKDFSDATLQCALDPLLKVWDFRSPENPYYRNESLFQWITAGVEFLFKIQHANGSFDQCYPNERAVGNVYELFESVSFFLDKAQGKITEEKSNFFWTRFKKACEYTLSHNEDHGNIANHFALYSYTSYKMARLLKDKRFAKKGDKLLEKVISLQSPEGWFMEYDGADPGYETRTVYYLAKLASEFLKNEVLQPLSRSLNDFLVFCLHPDGSIGGEYGARNTMLCYPAGFEILSTHFSEAAMMAKNIRWGLEQGKIISLRSLDIDNLVRLAANYLEAHYHFQPDRNSAGTLPFENPVLEHTLPQAGLYFKSTKRYYLAMNYHKGGTFRLYDKVSGQLVLSDTSYGALTKKGMKISTNLLVKHQDISLNGNTIRFKASFCKVLQQNMTPFKMICLRIAALSVLRVGFFSRFFSRYVAKTLFTDRQMLPFILNRSFVFKDESLEITDSIKNAKELTLFPTSFSTSIHMASSKYFSDGDLPLLNSSLASIGPFKTNHGNGDFVLRRVISFVNPSWVMKQSLGEFDNVRH